MKYLFNKHTLVVGKPHIGKGVWIGAFCVIDGLHNSLIIGRGTNIASGAHILTHSTVKRCISERRYGFIDSAPTEIGEFCFIGANAVVLMGSKIGHHSTIAAGAIVRENSVIPPYSVVAGVPARVIGKNSRTINGEEKENISIVIPAYNEEQTIVDVVKDALREVSKIVKDFEILIVDDGSTDRTGKFADNLTVRNKKIRVIHHISNKGFTGAILSCYENARKNLVFLAPADGQFDFKELNSFVREIRGFDVAVGYRVNNTRVLNRKINSKLFHALCNIFFGISFKEISGVILWRRRVLKNLNVESSTESAMIEPELIYKAIHLGYKFTEVPFRYIPRRAGKSKGANVVMIALTFIEMMRFWWKQRVLI